ncbi:MAG: hypothetical protein U0638_12615 [Phycisphaerales bacterium]
MGDDVLERFTRRAVPPAGVLTELDPDAAEDYACFGWLRGVRERALMLELRKLDGRVMAVGYAWLERVAYEPETGITLLLPGITVKIRGSGLNTSLPSGVRLLDGILRHRVPWIAESGRAAVLREPRVVAVEGVEWE